MKAEMRGLRNSKAVQSGLVPPQLRGNSACGVWRSTLRSKQLALLLAAATPSMVLLLMALAVADGAGAAKGASFFCSQVAGMR